MTVTLTVTLACILRYHLFSKTFLKRYIINIHLKHLFVRKKKQYGTCKWHTSSVNAVCSSHVDTACGYSRG